MKTFKEIPLKRPSNSTLSWVSLSVFFLLSVVAMGQCPVPGVCTFTAVSGSNYTVASGQVLCINAPTNYSSGTITLNGGTVYVASGATLGVNIYTSATSTLNNCGTISAGKQFDNVITVNHFAPTNLSLDLSNGHGVNLMNYSDNITINAANLNTTNASI
ncbi:MAG: hypothetical protein K2Q22_11285, partial [Cytophagales bacterium]|nr:hypothetical protein [Cytophagales bacterium]